MSTIEVRKVEPAALSPKGVSEYLSLSKRSVSTLIADQVLLAKRCGGRTLVDFASVKKFRKLFAHSDDGFGHGLAV